MKKMPHPAIPDSVSSDYLGFDMWLSGVIAALFWTPLLAIRCKTGNNDWRKCFKYPSNPGVVAQYWKGWATEQIALKLSIALNPSKSAGKKKWLPSVTMETFPTAMDSNPNEDRGNSLLKAVIAQL